MAKEGAIVMGVCVDKTGGQVLALPINFLLAWSGAANFCNPSISDADVAGAGLPAESIKNLDVSDRNVIHKVCS
jgi:hypothetical protein